MSWCNCCTSGRGCGSRCCEHYWRYFHCFTDIWICWVSGWKIASPSLPNLPPCSPQELVLRDLVRYVYHVMYRQCVLVSPPNWVYRYQTKLTPSTTISFSPTSLPPQCCGKAPGVVTFRTIHDQRHEDKSELWLPTYYDHWLLALLTTSAPPLQQSHTWSTSSWRCRSHASGFGREGSWYPSQISWFVELWQASRWTRSTR